MKLSLSSINTQNIKKGINYIRYNGLGGVWARVRYKMSGPAIGYNTWYRDNHMPKPDELERECEDVFDYMPCFSILVPIYMTPEKFLRDMIESVCNQTYPNWQLCIVDATAEPENFVGVQPDNDSENVNIVDTETIVREYMEKDDRICYRRLEENYGIAGNTNKALELAVGEYIGLLDHDDVLTPDALYQVAKALQEDKYEVLYSDEDKMSEAGNKFTDPAFKPDFNIDLLRAHNYITHFFVVKGEVAHAVGGFDREYDGAQDYDFILKCCEYAVQKNIRHIVAGGESGIKHIPRVLYHWRVSGKSVAADVHSKEYAKEAGKRAVSAHLLRTGAYATVTHSEMWGIYKVIYDTPGNPFLSIVIAGPKQKSVISKCLLPLFDKARYSNFEIIIVNTHVNDEQLDKFYRRMEGMRRNIHVIDTDRSLSLPEMRNLGAKRANGDYILFLDGNTEIIDYTSIGEMLGICMRQEVGIVSGTLYNDNDAVCHSGIAVGINGVATYLYQGIKKGGFGYLMHNRVNCDYSAVSAACMMVKKELFTKLGGFSDKFKSDLSDIDFCLRARERGVVVVCAADAGWYYHAEGSDMVIESTPAEQDLFQILWASIIQNGDPFYNPNFKRNGAPFTL